MTHPRSEDELLHAALPKWPQCIITGTTLNEQQALEIIRRTDRAFTTLMFEDEQNDYRRWFANIIHLPVISFNSETVHSDFEAREAWACKWGFLPLQYLYNDWIDSNMVQGAQGWCHPDGTIGYFYNIGKWPEVPEVLDDLKCLAENFPFLELEVTLMNEEYGLPEYQSRPLVSFLVRCGNVQLVDPAVKNLHEEFNRIIPSAAELNNMATQNFMYILKTATTGDHKISKSIIQRWAQDHLT